MEIYKNNLESIGKIFLVIIAFFISLIFFHSPGTHDVLYWLNDVWMPSFEKFGLVKGYAVANDNYPPLSFIMIGIVSKISNLFQIDKFVIFKSMILVFLYFTVLSFYKFTKNMTISIILFFSLIISSMALGYLDILFAPFLILSFFYLSKEKYLLFTIFFSLASLMKYQPLIIAPFILIFLIKINKISEIKKIDWLNLLKNVFIPGFLIILLFFMVFGEHLLTSLLTATGHKYLSGNALNFNWILTFILRLFFSDNYGGLDGGSIRYVMFDSMKVALLPKILFYFFYVYSLIAFFRIKERKLENLIVYSILGYLSYFIFNTGVHENHSFIVCLLFGMLMWLNNNYKLHSIIWLFISNINLIAFYGFYGGLPFSRVIFGIDITLIFSIFNVLMFIIYFQTIRHSLPYKVSA